MKHYKNRIFALVIFAFLTGGITSEIGQKLEASTITWFNSLIVVIIFGVLLLIGYDAGKESNKRRLK